MRTQIRAALDAAAAYVADWLGSRAAFLQVCLATLISIPLTVYGIDNHGFGFLYVATALSLVTQVPLAMIGVRAREEAHKAEQAALGHEEAQLQLLQNQTDIMQLVLSLAERDVQTGDRLQESVAALDADVDRMLEIASESRKLHAKNAALIEQLAQRNRTILEAAIEAANTTIDPSGGDNPEPR